MLQMYFDELYHNSIVQFGATPLPDNAFPGKENEKKKKNTVVRSIRFFFSRHPRDSQKAWKQHAAIGSGVHTHIERTDCPRDNRRDNGTWRPGRSPVGKARAFRTRRFYTGPTVVGPVRTRSVCSGRPCTLAGTSTRNRRRCPCTDCFVRKGSTRICPQPFLKIWKIRQIRRARKKLPSEKSPIFANESRDFDDTTM